MNWNSSGTGMLDVHKGVQFNFIPNLNKNSSSFRFVKRQALYTVELFLLIVQHLDEKLKNA